MPILIPAILLNKVLRHSKKYIQENCSDERALLALTEKPAGAEKHMYRLSDFATEDGRAGAGD